MLIKGRQASERAGHHRVAEVRAVAVLQLVCPCIDNYGSHQIDIGESCWHEWIEWQARNMLVQPRGREFEFCAVGGSPSRRRSTNVCHNLVNGICLASKPVHCLASSTAI